MTYLCVGSLHGPSGDCLRPIAGALFCYGYLDTSEDLAQPLESDAVEGPRPLLFPACKLHKAPLAEWAEHLWADIAGGMWVQPRAIAKVLGWMEAEDDPMVISPDPARAMACR